MVGVLVLALTYPAAAFYQEPRLLEILPIIALANVILGFENIAVVRLLKDLLFSREFAFRFTQRLLRFLTVVGLAFYFESYWALVYGTLIGAIVAVALSFIVMPYAPRFSLAKLGEMFHFTKWLLANNILDYLRMRGSDFVIGRVEGPAMLGTFNVGYEVATLPTTELASGVNRAVYPTLVKMRDEDTGEDEGAEKSAGFDHAMLRDGFLSILNAMALLSLPAGVGVALLAEQLIPVLLGENWYDAIPIVQLLALQGALAAISGSCSYVFLTLGRPRTMAIIGGIQVPILLALIIVLTLEMGVIGAAYAHVIVALVALPVPLVILGRALNVGFFDYATCLWRSVVACLAMAACVHLTLQTVLAEGFGQIVAILSAVSAGVVSYGVLVLVLWWLSGRPAGLEQAALDKAAALLFRREVT